MNTDRLTINPLTQNDFYKQGHAPLYPPGTTRVYSNITARKSRIKGINSIVVFGPQYFIKAYLMGEWQRNFFDKPLEQVRAKYFRVINNTLGPGAVSEKRIKDLHDLGYLPLSIKALPEGVSCPIRVPCLTITNTVDHAYWLVNFLESILSCITWQPITSATIAKEFRRVLDAYAMETVGDTSFVQWQGHDFSMRGMSSLETACTSGGGHLLSFTGTDTIPAIEFLEQYYNADVEKELVGASVVATEHAVAGFNIISILNDKPRMADELADFIKRTPEGMMVRESYDELLIAEFAFLKWLITVAHPNGLVSYVGDTYNLFSVIAEILPRLKPEIMARNGKLVIRPDSFWTDPVDCLCGFGGWNPRMEELTAEEVDVVRKGLIESLWDIFGGTKTIKDYKLLDSHIGAIYGDSITIERAEAICLRFKAKGFASINSVYGVGSYTYQFNTRDTFGLAIKATWGMVNGQPVNVFKDPVSDEGMKKSARGLIRVEGKSGHYTYKDCCTPEEEAGGELKEVFRDGKLLIDYTLAQIRANLAL